MHNSSDKKFVVIANSEPSVLSSVPRMLMCRDKNLMVEIYDFIKWPHQKASDFSTCISRHAVKGNFPDVLLVDHYAGTHCAREILQQYLRAAGELGQRPKVVLFSGCGADNLEEEAEHIRQTMPTFAKVSCLPMAATFDQFITHIRGNTSPSTGLKKVAHG